MQHDTPPPAIAELIDNLSQDLSPAPALRPLRQIMLGLGLLLLPVALLVDWLGWRMDWPLIAGIKIGLWLASLLLCVRLVQLLASPALLDRIERRSLLLLGLLVAGLFTAQAQLAPGNPQDSLSYPSYYFCLAFIGGVGLIAYPFLAWLLRRARPAQPAIFAAVLAMAGGSFAAVLYAAHCLQDTAFYALLAYLPPILALGLLAALLPPRQWR